MTVGTLLFVRSYPALVYKPLETISNTVGSLQQLFISLRVSFNLLDTEPDIKDAPDAVDPWNGINSVLPDKRALGRGAFDNVHFHYKGRVDTLRDISFEAEARQ